MSKDVVPFCLDSPDLTEGMTAVKMFMTKAATVNEIQNESGIFSFDLSWSEIQTLKPNLVGPYSQQGLKRNPTAKNSGKLMTSADFLAFSKRSNVSSILIDIHVNNAPYLAARVISIVDAVSSALINASDDKETRQEVLIMSDDSAVLGAFKKLPAFKRVLQIGHRISNASKPSVEELAKFTDAVLVNRGSVVQAQGSFLSRFTAVIEKMHAVNLSVYVRTLKNEFMNLGFDFLADPAVEVTTYSSLMADGIVTEFPATTRAYAVTSVSTSGAGASASAGTRRRSGPTAAVGEHWWHSSSSIFKQFQHYQRRHGCRRWYLLVGGWTCCTLVIELSLIMKDET